MNAIQEIKQSWDALLQKEPKLRIRNAAERLGVSELELLLTRLGENVFLLNVDFGQFLKDIESVGRVKAITRNDQVVHEKVGVYHRFSVMGKGQMGLCLGDIDLRVFLSRWKYGFFVADETPRGTLESFQFFNAAGEAVHKIYKIADTDGAQWLSLVDANKAEKQMLSFSAQVESMPTYAMAGERTEDDVRKEWLKLRDVHDFNAMLKRLAIPRLEALNLVGRDCAKPLDISSAEVALSQSKEKNVPIMVFVGNNGVIQIHTGPIDSLRRTGCWFNILDPEFNLHLNTDEITQAWLIRRPSDDGTITSIDFFNENDELIMTLFGQRKPGQQELESWRSVVTDLEENFAL